MSARRIELCAIGEVVAGGYGANASNAAPEIIRVARNMTILVEYALHGGAPLEVVEPIVSLTHELLSLVVDDRQKVAADAPKT